MNRFGNRVTCMNRNEIVNYLQNRLSETRFKHCLGVESVCLKLAARFGVDPEHASFAALLHDLCREYDRDSLLKLAVNFGIVVDDIEKSEPLLLHGAVGAGLARRELEIEEPAILAAITYHITGAAGIGPLARLIFVGDFIEPGRTFEQARILRDEADKLAPEQLLLMVYNRSITYVINRNYLLHPRSLEGRNELIHKGIR